MNRSVRGAAKRVPGIVRLAAWTVSAIAILAFAAASAPSIEALLTSLPGPVVEFVKWLWTTFGNKPDESGWSLSRPYEPRNGDWRCDIYYLDAHGEVKVHSVEGASAEEALAEAQRRGRDLFGK